MASTEYCTMMTKLLAGAIGQPQDDDEVARVMQKLRDEKRAAAEAQMAEALAKGIPDCLLELDALPAEELRAIFKAAFEKFDAEDAARLAPRGAAPTTEPAPEAWTADNLRGEKNHFDGKWTRRGERGDMGARSGAWPGDQLR